MKTKISLALFAALLTGSAFAQTVPPQAACDSYNQLYIGMSIGQVQNIVDGQQVTTKQNGEIYLWNANSGYKYMLTFLDNGQPVGFSATSPTRIAYYPAAKDPAFSQAYPGPYGTPSLNEKQFVYLSYNKKINLTTAQQLLGNTGRVVGEVYQFSWPGNKVLTVNTDLNGQVHHYAINAYCGPMIPKKYIF